MIYNISICDDSDIDRDYLSGLVRRWADRGEHGVLLSLFSSAESFLFQYEENPEVHILLLDFVLGDMDGVTMARELRRENETVQIIFITGYSDYISEGYEVEALHYLMKPVKEEKLWSVLDRAAEKLHRDEQVLTLEIGGALIRVPIRQIRYLDVQGNYVTVHGREDYTLKKTLSQLEAELDERFFRLGRSAIVNLTCISRVTKTEVYLKDGSVIPLPRGAYEKINRAIIRMG